MENVDELIDIGDSISTVTKVRLGQAKKALLPMDVTLLGIMTEVRAEQS